MQRPLELVTKSGLVAIIRLDDLSCAIDLSRSLLRAGIIVQEFTLTNPEALSALAKVIEQVPAFTNGEATVGIGSVRTKAQASAATDAGAQFLVTPILAPEVIQVGQVADVPVVCGAYTPTEISSAWQRGASIVKVFPARDLGPNYIKDVLAPMPELKLMPTGGVDLSNMEAYFAAGAVAVGVGGNLFDKTALAESDWDKVCASAQEFARNAERYSAVSAGKQNRE